MDELAEPLLEFIRAHKEWAVVVIFITAFGESLAFASLLFPGTILLIAAGALMRAGTLPFLPLIAAAVLGALLGDFLSYWIGRRLGGRVGGLWPFRRNPEMLAVGIRFFERHGGKSVFIGKFFGPVRAVITLAAGIMRMSRTRFAIASIGSTLMWAPMLLLVGDVAGDIGSRFVGSANTVLLIVAGLTLFGMAALVWAALRAIRSKN
jgi:membrane protein DedA with SNARE-associated domain